MSALERWIQAVADWMDTYHSGAVKVRQDLCALAGHSLSLQQRIRVLEARLDALEGEGDEYVN